MNLLFRTDASVAMGTGHAMRCLALAQAWQDGGAPAVFAMAQTTAAIEALLAAESCRVKRIACAAGTDEDARETVALAREQRAEWIVVDGYQFDAEYQRALKGNGLKVLFLDDNGHATHYPADLVLNQNSYGSESMYGSREPYTRLLLGTEFSLLRREFGPWRGWKREVVPVGRKVLVTLGGSDPENVTRTVIEALRTMSGIEAIVVVGGSNPHFDDLQRVTAGCGDWLQLKRSVREMPKWMAWADVAISGAGSTCWEMCFLQLPMALIDLAENQKAIARHLQSLGAAVHLGTAGAVTKSEIGWRVAQVLSSKVERGALSAACGKLVDGRGADRVLHEMAGG